MGDSHHQLQWWQMLMLSKRRRSSTASSGGGRSRNHSIQDDSTVVSWHFSSQVKSVTEGKNSKEADRSEISCMSYDDTGEMLAAGSKDGKVVIFRQDQEVHNNHENNNSINGLRSPTYSHYRTFQSHEKVFDFLKTVEIDEKINKLYWLKRTCPSRFLLSANEKIVKLWKVSERRHQLDFPNPSNGQKEKNVFLTKSLNIPKYKPTESRVVIVRPSRIFFKAHSQHINALSVNSDMETFLTADDLEINLWNIEVSDQSFNIVDTKPDNMEDLNEVITAAEFHPIACSSFAYSSSKGSIKLCDLRSSARCDRHAKIFMDKTEEANKTFFSGIIANISDIKFSQSGRYILARDYLNLKVWDLNMESRPVETYPVNELLRSKLCLLYENDGIFDKFECSWGCNDRFIVSGTYGNYFKTHDRKTKESSLIESVEICPVNNLNKISQRIRKISQGSKHTKRDELTADSFNLKKKLLHLTWHPNENIITNAVGNSVHFFQGRSNLFF